MRRPEEHVDAEDVEDVGSLVDQPTLTRGFGVHDADPSAAFGEGVGGGEPADAQAGDEDVQAGPVSVAVGQAGARFVGVEVAHVAPTTPTA